MEEVEEIRRNVKQISRYAKVIFFLIFGVSLVLVPYLFLVSDKRDSYSSFWLCLNLSGCMLAFVLSLEKDVNTLLKIIDEKD